MKPVGEPVSRAIQDHLLLSGSPVLDCLYTGDSRHASLVKDARVSFPHWWLRIGLKIAGDTLCSAEDSYKI